MLTTVIPPVLYQIDANTAHASRVASTDLGLVTVIGLNGTAYAFSGATSQIVTLDVTNGTTRFVSDIDHPQGCPVHVPRLAAERCASACFCEFHPAP